MQNINEIFDGYFCHPLTLGSIKLSNLFHADDRVLIYETRAGQQT